MTDKERIEELENELKVKNSMLKMFANRKNVVVCPLCSNPIPSSKARLRIVLNVREDVEDWDYPFDTYFTERQLCQVHLSCLKNKVILDLVKQHQKSKKKKKK